MTTKKFNITIYHQLTDASKLMLDSLQVLALSWQPDLQQQNQPEQATIPSPSTPQ